MSKSTEYFEVWAKENRDDLDLKVRRDIINPLMESIQTATGLTINIRFEAGGKSAWILEMSNEDGGALNLMLKYEINPLFTTDDMVDQHMWNWHFLSNIAVSFSFPRPALQVVTGNSNVSMYEVWDYSNDWTLALPDAIKGQADYVLNAIHIKIDNLNDSNKNLHARARQPENGDKKAMMKDGLIQNARISHTLQTSAAILEQISEIFTPKA